MSAATVAAGVAALGAVACLGRACTVARPAGGDASVPHDAERHPRPPSPGEDPSAAVPSGWWAAVLARSGIDGDPARWQRVAAAAMVLAGLVGAGFGGLGGAIVAPAVGAAVVAGALRQTRDRGATRADAVLPELVEHVGRGLRAGFDLRGALSAAAGSVPGVHARELDGAVARLGAGADLAAALAPWVDRHDRPPVRLVVAALEVASAAGGARARALDGVAGTLRSRLAVDREVRSLASQASASAVVLVALPVVFGVVGSVADPRLAHTLFATAPGLACVGVAALLDGLGAAWMQRILRSV